MKILLVEGIDEIAYDNLLKNGYDVELISHSLNENELIKKIYDVNVIGIRSKTYITKNILDNAPNLLAIAFFCIGTNQVDIEECTMRGIAVFNSPYCNTRSVAELAIAEIIMLSRRLGDVNIEMHNDVWTKSSKGCFEVRYKVLGIVGYGHVGSQLSVLAQSMGMKVIYYDILNVMRVWIL